MKKYLFIALAALGFAACAEKMDDNSPVQKGEVESSYIAISLSATDPSTRADDGTYQDGEADERAIETAYFFFFNEDGTAFPVNINDGAANAPGGTNNYLQATINPTIGEAMPNVSDIKNVVLLLKSYVGTYPAKIVAVLNWVPTEETYSLGDLKGELVDVRSNEDGNLKGKFVMSNAVYATEGTPATAVYATPLTADNIFTDEANAKANPVTIYVERVAAKVTVTTADGKDVFNLNKPVTIGGSNTPVYAKVLGWELYNDYQQSYLVKNIDPEDWTVANLGFNWNDSSWYRSYWATSYTGEFPDNKFQYEYVIGESKNYGFGFGTAANVTNGTYAENTYTYCGENTGRAAANRTKIILKAKLQKENGDAVELARWYTTEYLGEKDLRTAVANTLKYTLYYKVGDNNYVGLEPGDLQCVSPTYDANGEISNGAPESIKSYEVFFQLSSTGKGKTWYKNNGGSKLPISEDSSSDPHGVAAANKYLSLNVIPATLYKSGQTYYYFDVQHLGKQGSDGEYGIVRNHIYAININSIGGYGSPIYIGTSNIVTPPEYPDDPTGEETSFVSAEVRILSWRIVSHGVDIQPNPEPTPGV